MNSSLKFPSTRSGYLVRRLVPEDADLLQPLYEQCSAFFELTNGVPPAQTAARDEFDDVPDGKTPDDIYIFGLFDARDALVGAIAAVRHYPDEQTWWLGLMLLAPAQRRQGRGTDFYQAFEHWVATQGSDHISLIAIETNQSGRQFWQQMGFEVTRTIASKQFKRKVHRVYGFSRRI